MREILGASAFGPFRDVRWDRESSALDLVAKGELLTGAKAPKDFHGEPATALPNFQVLERLISHT